MLDAQEYNQYTDTESNPFKRGYYKLAVLLTGSPRFVSEGADWWFNKALPFNCDIDYYGHCWDEADEIGKERYDSKLNVRDFEKWPFTDFKFSRHTRDIDLYDSLRNKDTRLSRFVFRDKGRDHIVSVHNATKLMMDKKVKYDLVLVMRYDTIIKPGALDKCISFIYNFKDNVNKFHKGYDTALFKNDTNPNIFTSWVQVRQGLPCMQDYMFISRYDDWIKYAGNLYNTYKKLLNEDNKFLECTNFAESIYHPHVFWAFLGMYSKANFLSHDDLGCVALRSSKEKISEWWYEDIVKEHDEAFTRMFNG